MCLVAVGFTTDSEWNLLRTKGYSRPLSIFQICADVRSKFSHMSLKRMIAMITPQCMLVLIRNNLMHIIMFPLCFTLDQNGTLTAMSPNNTVSLELPAEIHKWYSEGAKQDDVVER